ncbi:MAG: ATP-binding cassette domain-containing protein [Clostridiales bacterium]|nr:ABC transporter ATP-binding protein [Flavonifractor sp.]MDU2196636.1 ATP-binding cassette domain-containing protein [Clostridiales bacterium]
MPEVLELDGVCRDFTSGVFRTHTVHAVDHVTFALEKGKTFGLVGNSGCGKTTLSRMITRVLRPTAGRILFEGTDISGLPGGRARAYHRRVQMIFQNPEASLDPTMRVRDSLLEALTIHQIGSGREERMEKVRSALAQVGLPEYLLSRYPHQISGGEGQRLVICRALLLEPEVLLLDEPTSMLDVSVQASVMNLLKELQQRLGLTYLYITHDIELLGWISHTIGVMQKGRLVEVGPREQIMEAPAHPYTKELLYAYRHWE